MIKFLSVVTVLLAFNVAQAQERFELGIGAGSTHPVNGDTFTKAASSGDGQSYWLGYGFDENWGVELSLDNADFDVINSKHKAISLAGVYRFIPTSVIHPIAKLGLSSIESERANLKTTSMGAKAAAGLEADLFKYVSVGALVNFYHIVKSDDAANLKDTQAIAPGVFLTLHNALDGDSDEEQSKSAAPEAAAPVAQAVGDADKDGVNDNDDKCPSTPAGVVVNQIGCSEKEKASVRLNVTFATGKAVLADGSQSEIDNLASFMKKFPEANAEIAGHTDSTGQAKTNEALSQKRADAVKDALVKAGVEASRLTAKGYGSAQPIADNKTKAGRDQNRRVTAEISLEVDKKK